MAATLPAFPPKPSSMPSSWAALANAVPSTASRPSVEKASPLSHRCPQRGCDGLWLAADDSEAFRPGLRHRSAVETQWGVGLDVVTGAVVAAIDGIEICSSYVRCCPDCIKSKVEHKVEGELRQDIQYYHRLCLLTIVSSGFPIPLGIVFRRTARPRSPARWPYCNSSSSVWGAAFWMCW